ncbi:MAG: Flagellin [Nocardioides sp.]|jgi:flagellar hook-associated protein 3 FlgL|nr:Flagellin [Nocardioides sp.]
MGTTRVTESLLTHRSLTSLQGSLSRLGKVQEHLSTGRVVNRPSDDPNAASAAMRFRAATTRQEAYVRNASDGMAWLGTIDNTLGSMSTEVRRARELGLQGASTGSTSQAARDALAVEVDQLRESLRTHANATYLGRPVLGGVTAGSVAFDPAGAYVGTPGQVLRTVGDGVKVRVDVTGTDVVGPTGDSLFDDLADLSAALRAGDGTAMRTALGALEGRLQTINATQSTVGAAYNRVESAAQTATEALDELRGRLSEAEETDLPKAIVQLKMQETAYQAALAATARVMQPSLVQFLR